MGLLRDVHALMCLFCFFRALMCLFSRFWVYGYLDVFVGARRVVMC